MAPDDAPQPRPGVRPERDVDHPGLVLEGEEDRALRRHRVLAGDDEATDPDVARLPLVERRIRDRTEPLERRPVQLDHLAAGIEPDHGVGVADPLRLVRPGSVGASVAGRRRAIGRELPG